VWDKFGKKIPRHIGQGPAEQPRPRPVVAGGEGVQYLVVVPEHVNVSVQLPDGGTVVTDRSGIASLFRATWARGASEASAAEGLDARMASLEDDANVEPRQSSGSTEVHVRHRGEVSGRR
jgi:hypothetical protein